MLSLITNSFTSPQTFEKRCEQTNKKIQVIETLLKHKFLHPETKPQDLIKHINSDITSFENERFEIAKQIECAISFKQLAIANATTGYLNPLFLIDTKEFGFRFYLYRIHRLFSWVLKNHYPLVPNSLEFLKKRGFPETQADLLMFNLVENVARAKHFFSCTKALRDLNKILMNPCRKWLTTFLRPEALFSITHPNPKGRIESTETAFAKRNSR